MIVFDVCLLLVLLTLGLAVGTVPVDQDHQGQDEHAVGDHDRVEDRSQRLRPVVGGDDNPGVHSGVMAWEGRLVLQIRMSSTGKIRV